MFLPGTIVTLHRPLGKPIPNCRVMGESYHKEGQYRVRGPRGGIYVVPAEWVK